MRRLVLGRPGVRVVLDERGKSAVRSRYQPSASRTRRSIVERDLPAPNGQAGAGKGGGVRGQPRADRAVRSRTSCGATENRIAAASATPTASQVAGSVRLRDAAGPGVNTLPAQAA